jgi:hypothetical protein
VTKKIKFCDIFTTGYVPIDATNDAQFGFNLPGANNKKLFVLITDGGTK